MAYFDPQYSRASQTCLLRLHEPSGNSRRLGLREAKQGNFTDVSSAQAISRQASLAPAPAHNAVSTQMR